MPIYEYLCCECNEPHEALRKMSDEPLLDCPACGKPGLKKQVSASGFRLSGSGWYETDFKSGNKRNIVDSGKSESEKPAASKPAASKKESPSKQAGSGKTSAASSCGASSN